MNLFIYFFTISIYLCLKIKVCNIFFQIKNRLFINIVFHWFTKYFLPISICSFISFNYRQFSNPFMSIKFWNIWSCNNIWQNSSWNMKKLSAKYNQCLLINTSIYHWTPIENFVYIFRLWLFIVPMPRKGNHLQWLLWIGIKYFSKIFTKLLSFSLDLSK